MFRKVTYYLYYLFFRLMPRRIYQLLQSPTRNDSVAQITLISTYRNNQKEHATPLVKLSESGFSMFSQSDEDGILLYIFSLIGTTNKKCVEISAGTGVACNTANLIINHGWYGLLFDGDPLKVKIGQSFFSKHSSTYIYPPIFEQAWITRDNINDILRKHDFTGDIDLFSLDVDGVDYWLWDAITAMNPRVVVVEYQDVFGSDEAVTVPYADSFDGYAHGTTEGAPNYAGASLAAFTKLATSRGYRLVGCNKYGFNAFYVKEGIAGEMLPEVSVAECLDNPKVKHSIAVRYPKVKDLEWVNV